MTTGILKDKNLDAMVITDPFNMRYVSGFRGGEGILYISNTQKVLVTDSRYTEQAENESDFTVVEEKREKQKVSVWDMKMNPSCAHSLIK